MNRSRRHLAIILDIPTLVRAVNAARLRWTLSGLRCHPNQTTNLNRSQLLSAPTAAMNSISVSWMHLMETAVTRLVCDSGKKKLWDEFAKSYPDELPQSPVDIAKVFGIEIPPKVLHWVQMDDDENYVADLIQLPSGSRYLQPRNLDDETTPHTVFTTCVATGRELRDCQTGNVCVPLTNGKKFAMDAHGIWMTLPEADTLFNDMPIDDEQPPWVNGMPPLFPPK